MLLSYHNKPEIKDKYVKRMEDHISADELSRGIGFVNNKGCAVGCTLNSYNHSQFPIELGIPEWLARVLDRVFEGMSLEKSKTYPLLFLESIKVGVDLEKIKIPFLLFVLNSLLDKFDHNKFPEVLNSINTVIQLYKNGETDLQKFKAAYAYADAYADAAYADAAYAAAAAAYAAYAAYADAAAAYAAAYAAYAAADACEMAYNKFADKLIELIKNCK